MSASDPYGLIAVHREKESFPPEFKDEEGIHVLFGNSPLTVSLLRTSSSTLLAFPELTNDCHSYLHPA